MIVNACSAVVPRSSVTCTVNVNVPAVVGVPLAARGMTNKDIAAVLFIAKTVANHIERIYLKIGASNRAMASLFAMKHGLLPGEEPMRATS